MSMIVYLALLAAAVIALRHSPGRALLWVYLPVLLLIPNGFRAITPGLPDPNFNQAAIIPIALVALHQHLRDWRPTLMDGVVLLFAAWVGYSDYAARGYDDAQNLMFAMLTSVLGPYFAARWLITAEGIEVAVARRVVILVFAAAVIGVWEFRFGFNPFYALLGPLFPGQGTGWVTTFRHGVARVAGPYSHAILAGIMMVIAFRLQRWLQWAGHWEPRFNMLPALPWSKASVITWVLLLGALMTVARGPWLGALAAAAIAAIGHASDRRRALWWAGASLAVAAVLGGVAMSMYLDIQPGKVITTSQESALYRKVLFEKYLDIAIDGAWFGWGLTTWPRVPGMESIDNYFLLLSLMHGLPACLMLLLMLVGSTAQCLHRGVKEVAGSEGPAFAFAGCFMAILVSLATVYLGEQVQPMLFLLLGWSQAWLQQGQNPTGPINANMPTPGPSSRGFRNVIE